MFSFQCWFDFWFFCHSEINSVGDISINLKFPKGCVIHYRRVPVGKIFAIKLEQVKSKQTSSVARTRSKERTPFFWALNFRYFWPKSPFFPFFWGKMSIFRYFGGPPFFLTKTFWQHWSKRRSCRANNKKRIACRSRFRIDKIYEYLYHQVNSINKLNEFIVTCACVSLKSNFYTSSQNKNHLKIFIFS